MLEDFYFKRFNLRTMSNKIQTLTELISLSDPHTDWMRKFRYIASEMVKNFQAEDAVFIPSDEKNLDNQKSFSLYGDSSYLAKYESYYWRCDPVYKVSWTHKPIMSVFKTDDIIPYPELMKLEFYEDFLRPQNQLKELIIRLRSIRHFFGVISFQRSPKQPNFDNEDMLIARNVLPHISEFFERESIFSKTRNIESKPAKYQVAEQNESTLTNREWDIIKLIAEGLTDREISQKLFISKFTVGTHIKNILSKTNYRNRTQLANLTKEP